MGLYLPSLAAAATHTGSVVVCLVGLAAFLHLCLRARKLTRIIEQLRALPAGKRRYVLEREHHIYPGTENLPIAFLRKRRAKAIAAAAAALGLPLLGVAGFSVRLWMNARAVAWELDDSSLVPSGHGLAWDVVLRNRSDETVEIRRVDLEILSSAPSSARAPAPSPVDPDATVGRRIVILQPGIRLLPVVPEAEAFSIPPRSPARLALFLDPGGAAGRKLTYGVRLIVRWRVLGRTAVLAKQGKSHQIGWAAGL